MAYDILEWIRTIKYPGEQARRVFKFEDGTGYWIAAYTQEQAEDYFLNELDGNKDYTVEEVTGEALVKMLWSKEEERYVSWKTIADESPVPNCIGDDSGYY